MGIPVKKWASPNSQSPLTGIPVKKWETGKFLAKMAEKILKEILNVHFARLPLKTFEDSQVLVHPPGRPPHTIDPTPGMGEETVFRPAQFKRGLMGVVGFELFPGRPWMHFYPPLPFHWTEDS